MSNIKNVQEYAPAMQVGNWKRTSKKKYQIYVCMPPLGTKVYNFLEDVHYETSEKKPFVLSGTVGEQWVIDPAKLFKTYRLPNGQPLNLDFLKTKGHPYKVDWFKAQTEKAYRERQLDIEEKKVDIEIAQLRDGNPYNDQIRME